MQENTIDISDFKKIRLRVGKVLEAERVPNSEKLVKIRVDFGDSTKTILAGINKWYNTDELLHKKVIAVYNMKPAKLAGIESEGMLLAAMDSEGKLSLLSLDKDIKEGADIS